MGLLQVMEVNSATSYDTGMINGLALLNYDSGQSILFGLLEV